MVKLTTKNFKSCYNLLMVTDGEQILTDHPTFYLLTSEEMGEKIFSFP
jgi:hypothetical protein